MREQKTEEEEEEGEEEEEEEEDPRAPVLPIVRVLCRWRVCCSGMTMTTLTMSLMAPRHSTHPPPPPPSSLPLPLPPLPSLSWAPPSSPRHPLSPSSDKPTVKTTRRRTPWMTATPPIAAVDPPHGSPDCPAPPESELRANLRATWGETLVPENPFSARDRAGPMLTTTWSGLSFVPSRS